MLRKVIAACTIIAALFAIAPVAISNANAEGMHRMERHHMRPMMRPHHMMHRRMHHM
jgi:hypothetical protein